MKKTLLTLHEGSAPSSFLPLPTYLRWAQRHRCSTTLRKHHQRRGHGRDEGVEGRKRPRLLLLRFRGPRPRRRLRQHPCHRLHYRLCRYRHDHLECRYRHLRHCCCDYCLRFRRHLHHHCHYCRRRACRCHCWPSGYPPHLARCRHLPLPLPRSAPGLHARFPLHLPHLRAAAPRQPPAAAHSEAAARHGPLHARPRLFVSSPAGPLP